MRSKNYLLLILFIFIGSAAFAGLAPASDGSAETGRSLIWFKKKKKTVETRLTPAQKDSARNAESYDKLTGKDVVIRDGMFRILKKKTDYYFEIPTSLLGRDMLVVNKMQKVPYELNEAGVNRGINYENRLIRFETDKESGKLRVREVKPLPAYPEGDAIGQSVRENFISSLIAAFSIEAWNNDSTACIIKINDIYNGTETALNNVFDNINLGTSTTKNLSRITDAKAFENNVVVNSELSTKVKEGNETAYITVEVSSSLVLLPEKPMTGRFENARVGYFSTPRFYFSDKQQKLESRRLITRWRLEPRPEDREAYLNGQLVEPQKPIVFYIDNTTPPQWRPYIRQGIEDWQVAFEQAGFKNAIMAREMTDSIRMDADDVNYSVLTYVASPKVNAMGPSVYDPRSGEIIEADVIWWHNVMTMLQKWITVQTGAVDPAARTIQLPDSLMGDAMRFVACHEVGHSLGLRHNMMGSWAYPTDSLRSKNFTDRVNSTSSSIMDYARFNYVAQPGDGVTRLSPHIGPYDRFAIEYGYRWTDAVTPQEEKDFLWNLLGKHQGRLYKYSEVQDPRDAIDPRAQIEDLGDDPVRSSRLGIANLKRILPEIVDWSVTGEKGQTYQEAGQLYYAVLNQWNNYLYHVLANIGGMYLENTTIGDGQKTYTFVEKEKQIASLQFLFDEVLCHPEWLFNPPFTAYVYPMLQSPWGMVENAPSSVLKNAQSFIFWDLLENQRLIRMLENEAANGKKAFTAVDLMDRMHKHLFGITERGGSPDLAARSLQKGFVDALINSASESATNKDKRKLAGEYSLLEPQIPLCGHYGHDLAETESRSARRYVSFAGSQATRISDAISIKRGELLRIKELLERQSAVGNTAVRYHYKDLLLRINTALGIR